MEEASAAWRSNGEHKKEKKSNYISKSPLFGAFKTWNLDTVCLVPSKQGGPQARQLVLIVVEVISSLRSTGARDVVASKLGVQYATESRITTERTPWGEGGASCPGR